MSEVLFGIVQLIPNKIKYVNQDFYIASLLIQQHSSFEEVCCLILATTQRSFVDTRPSFIRFLKFEATIKEIKKFKFV